jgi:hypothetical protein
VRGEGGREGGGLGNEREGLEVRPPPNERLSRRTTQTWRWYLGRQLSHQRSSVAAAAALH